MSKAAQRLVLNLETLKRLDPVHLPEVQAGLRTGVCASGTCKASVDITCIHPYTIPCVTTVPI
ncbi:MAG: hypothetical protein IPL96_14085 [Holophagaceae bacterium]|nr:hypothetical protein [Holophagaceae bacterium]